MTNHTTASEFTCPADHAHGATLNCYVRHHCRCAPCRAASAASARHRSRQAAYGRPVQLPAIGARRRLQALACNGWSIYRLADMLDCRPRDLLKTIRENRFITRARHERIDDLYRQLWASTPVPANRFYEAGITRTRRYAAAHGWVPPLGWDDIDNDPEPPAALPSGDYIDEVAVLRALDGEALELNDLERIDVIRHLNAAGNGDPSIAAYLGCTARTVLRLRQRAGIPAAVNAAMNAQQARSIA